MQYMCVCVCAPLGPLTHPLLAVAGQLVLQIFGLELQLGALLDLLLPLRAQLFLLLLHGRHLGLQLTHHALRLLHTQVPRHISTSALHL